MSRQILMASAPDFRLQQMLKPPKFNDTYGMYWNSYPSEEAREAGRKLKIECKRFEEGKPEEFVRFVAYLLNLFVRMGIEDEPSTQLYIIANLLGNEPLREWNITWSAYLAKREEEAPDVPRQQHVTATAIKMVLRSMIAIRVFPPFVLSCAAPRPILSFPNWGSLLAPSLWCL